MKITRWLFLATFYSFMLVVTSLSISRHYYEIGGQRLQGKEEIFIFLSELLPNIYHIINNNGFPIEGLLVERKKDINPNEFIVFGLFPYLTDDGWVILDRTKKSNRIIPIKWDNLKKTYLKFTEAKETINNLNAAAPINPIKLGENIIFHLGNVLFNYNVSKDTYTAYKGLYHHSIELFQDSLLYVCIIGKDTLPNLNDGIMIMNLNTQKPVFQKSISEILIENKYKGLLYGSSNIKQKLYINYKYRDVIHLNDIQPIRMKTNFAEIGDVLISMRHLSTVMLYRPSTNKILWLSQGPWFNQHDADVINEDEIGVYNNNYIRNIEFNENESSQIITYNFKTQKYGTLHKKIFEKYQIKSKFSSRFEILNNGNMFVEDSPSGAYYLISHNGDLISRKSFNFDKNRTSIGSWARPYTSKPY